jgi:N-acylglucosamine 2-epimerase
MSGSGWRGMALNSLGNTGSTPTGGCFTPSHATADRCANAAIYSPKHSARPRIGRRAAGDELAQQQARGLFELILRYHTTPGLLEPKVIPSTRQLKSHAMPMILLATTQILRQSGDDLLYKDVIDRSLHEVFAHFMKPEFQALLENVGSNGEFLDEPDGREVNPGHAIETAWFIMEEARFRDNDPERLKQACRILDWSLDIGWDEVHDGILISKTAKDIPARNTNTT